MLHEVLCQIVVFRRAQDLSAALEACEGWGCWQQAFVLSAELHQSEEDKMALARRMADKLKQKRQYRDAAQVLSQYADDTEEAIVVLLEGGAWADALCMVSDVEVVNTLSPNEKQCSKIVSSVSPHIFSILSGADPLYHSFSDNLVSKITEYGSNFYESHTRVNPYM